MRNVIDHKNKYFEFFFFKQNCEQSKDGEFQETVQLFCIVFYSFPLTILFSYAHP